MQAALRTKIGQWQQLSSHAGYTIGERGPRASPAQAGCMGRGGARERSEECPFPQGVANRADFAPTMSGSDCNIHEKPKLVQLLEFLLCSSMAKPLDLRPPQSRGSGGKAE